MEAAMAVAPLVLTACGIISKIIEAAETSIQNKVECHDLASRLPVTRNLLLQLRLQGPDAEEALAGLCVVLNEAHELVDACQKSSLRRKLARADVLAERFSKVNHRIDSHLNIIQLCCQVGIARRLDQIIPPARATVLLPLPTATSSRSLTVATTARYGQRMRKRDVIKSFARVTIGVLFHKPEYIARGAAAFLK